MSSDASRPDDSQRPTNFRWGILGLACGTSWLLYLHRYCFALIKPELMKEWNLDEQQLGFLDSAFSVCYTAFQFPLGIAADAIGVRLVLTALILIWTSGFALHAAAPSVGIMWYARAMLGLGQSAAYASVSRVSKTWFPRSTRTTAQGWSGVFFGRFGGLSASFLLGYLMLGLFGLEWRTAFCILAAVGVFHGVLFWAVFRDSPRRHPLVNTAEADLIEKDDRGDLVPRMSVREMFGHMSPRSIANLLALNVQSILSTVADNIYSNWIPLFLAQVHNLEFKQMGLYWMLPLLGGACGGVIGGWLNDRMISMTGNRRWSRTIVGLGGKGIAAMLLVTALVWYDNPRTFCVILFVVKLFSDCGLSTTWGTVTDIGGRSTATVFALNNSVAGIGSIAAPVLFGTMAKFYGWPSVFITAAAAYLLCALSWLLVNCTIPVVAEDTQ